MDLLGRNFQKNVSNRLNSNYMRHPEPKNWRFWYLIIPATEYLEKNAQSSLHVWNEIRGYHHESNEPSRTEIKHEIHVGFRISMARSIREDFFDFLQRKSVANR